MELEENWDEVKDLFRASFRSSFHYAVATVTDKGEPHVTPIGSLILGEPCRGFYFEKFPRQLPENLAANRQVCVLAVNSSPMPYRCPIKRDISAPHQSSSTVSFLQPCCPAHPSNRQAYLWPRR